MSPVIGIAMTTIAKIGAQIRSARNEQKLTARDVADMAGIHPNTLLLLERGVGNVELSRLLAIASVLKLSLMLVPNAVSELVAADSAQTKTTEMGDRIRNLMPK